MIANAVSFLKTQLLIVCVFGVSLSAVAVTISDVDHQEIVIWSQGVPLAGDIYKPKELAPDKKLPGILMVPGWGGVKKNIEKNYAPHFAQQGFLVLAFDFKSWGESNGPLVAGRLAVIAESEELTASVTHIRKIINPLSMSEDVRAALHYLGSEPQVIPDNLGIWGTSMGGGLALVTAASDDRIKAFVNQMAPVNYAYNLRQVPSQKMRQLEAAVARGLLPPYPGPEGQRNPALRGYPDWATMKRFNPMSHAGQLKAPTLILDAEQEALFDRTKNGQLLYDTIKDRVPSRYVTYPGGHYDMYKGENLKQARKAALQWFVDHLKGGE